MPLPPFVALSAFFIGQHPSLLANPYHADPTIQLLYSIATRVFQEQITESEKPVEDLLLVCQKTEATITQALATLFKEIPDVTKWSRTKKILDDGNLVPVIFKRIYEAISQSEESSSTISTASNTNTIDSNSNTIASNTNTNTNRNWEYLEESLSNLNENVPVSWERIYDDGRALGLFGNYTKWNTIKSNYYRWKKNQN